MSSPSAIICLLAVISGSHQQNIDYDLSDKYDNVGKAVLLVHNKCRQETADMPDLVWNSTLARLALNYAGECKWEHSPQSYRTNAAGFRYVGENLAAGSRILVNSILESTAASAVERWCNERKYFTYPTTCDSGAMCGHYTQIVWSETSHVGCGLVTCAKDSKFIYPSGFFLVCEYGPGGNYIGQPPYPQPARVTTNSHNSVDRKNKSSSGNNLVFLPSLCASLVVFLLLL